MMGRAPVTRRLAARGSRPTLRIKYPWVLLPTLAAFGPLAPVIGPFYAFRVVTPFLIVLAVVQLGRQEWARADKALVVCALVSCGYSVAVTAVRGGNLEGASELLAVLLGFTCMIASRPLQRRDPESYLALCRGWVFAGALMVALAVREISTGKHFSNYLEELAYTNQPAATFGNPNALGVFLVFACIWSIPLQKTTGFVTKLLRWCLWLGTPYILLFAEARLCLGAFTVLVLLVVWDRLGRLKPLAVLVAVFSLVTLPRLRDLVSPTQELATRGTSGEVRLRLTMGGVRAAIEDGGIGLGAGQMESVVAARPDLFGTGAVNAHNIWVEILVQYGAITLVAWVVWLAVTAISGRSVRQVRIFCALLLPLGLASSSVLSDPQLWTALLTLSMAARPTPSDSGEVSARGATFERARVV